MKTEKLKMLNARDEILARIRAGKNEGAPEHISVPTADQTPIYKPVGDDRANCFRTEIEAVNGQCYIMDSMANVTEFLKEYRTENALPYFFCRDTQLAEQLTQAGVATSCQPVDFDAMQAGITTCECLVARTGSVVMSAGLSSGRQMHAYAPTHIVLAYADQLVDYVADALHLLQKRYGQNLPSSISFVTGPSRTADIEKTLVLGAHGPKKLIVLIINSKE